MKAYLIGRIEIEGENAKELIRLMEDIRRQYPDFKLSMMVYTDEEDAMGRLIDAMIDLIDETTALEEELGVSLVERLGDEEVG